MAQDPRHGAVVHMQLARDRANSPFSLNDVCKHQQDDNYKRHSEQPKNDRHISLLRFRYGSIPTTTNAWGKAKFHRSPWRPPVLN
jgi:hypothetical protein